MSIRKYLQETSRKIVEASSYAEWLCLNLSLLEAKQKEEYNKSGVDNRNLLLEYEQQNNEQLK